MRVLTVGALYPPHYQGGYEVVWRAFVHHLRARGDEVRVLCSGVRFPEVAPDAAEDADVHRDLWWHLHGVDPPLGRRDRVRRERHNARVLDRHLAGLRPD